MTRITYSPKLKEALDALRPQFTDISEGFATLTKRRADIAPAFTRAYRLWQRETNKTLVAFVHELDPTMPASDRKGYRQHSAYRAAQYLLQLAEGAAKDGPSGRTPLAMLALTIKTLLPLSHPHEENTLAVLLSATGWQDRDKTKLLGKVQRTRGVQLPHLPRLVKVAEASKAALVQFRKERLAS